MSGKRPTSRSTAFWRAVLLLWSVAGSYLVADLAAGWAARLLVGLGHWQDGEAVILTSLLAIAICAALVVWVFAHRSPVRATLILLLLTVFGLALECFIPSTFGSTGWRAGG